MKSMKGSGISPKLCTVSVSFSVFHFAKNSNGLINPFKMPKPQKDLSQCDEATLSEMLDYLCSKIDFGKSCLDSTAIQCMDQLFKELKKQDEKIKF